MAVSTLRSIERSGGLDPYLLGKSAIKLTGEALKLRKRIIKAQERITS